MVQTQIKRTDAELIRMLSNEYKWFIRHRIFLDVHSFTLCDANKNMFNTERISLLEHARINTIIHEHRPKSCNSNTWGTAFWNPELVEPRLRYLNKLIKLYNYGKEDNISLVLQIMLDNIHLINTTPKDSDDSVNGLCGLKSFLFKRNLISEDEAFKLYNIFFYHRPNHCNIKKWDGYFWKPGSIAPRKRYLEMLIKLYSI